MVVEGCGILWIVDCMRVSDLDPSSSLGRSVRDRVKRKRKRTGVYASDMKSSDSSRAARLDCRSVPEITLHNPAGVCVPAH